MADQGMLAAALAYAREGWPVFPCHPDTKRPLTPKGRDADGGFKHATTHKGEPRDDAVLLNSFSDEQNDGALFTGWHDYAQVAGRLPISAQVFQVW